MNKRFNITKFFFCITLLLSIFSYRATSAAEVQNRMNLDEPSAGSIIKENFTVRGWALNPSGVEAIKVYIDNTLVATTAINVDRHDVEAAYPSYENALKSGYKTVIDLNSVAPGQRTLKVEAIGKNKTIDSRTLTVNIQKPEAKMWVDTPNGITIKGADVQVKGWALNPSGIKTVNVYLDNVLMGTAKYGEVRSDVNVAYPGYPSGNNSGFSYTIPLRSVSTGKHTMKVEAIGNDGSKLSKSTSFENIALENKMYLDEPSDGLVVTEDITVRGWALNPSGVKIVNVYVDNTLFTTTNIGLTRSDVGQAYPDYKNSSLSGYSTKLSFNSITSGKKTIKVEAVGNDGTKDIRTSTIIVKKKPAQMWMDTPADGSRFNKKDIVVKGWALNDSIVKKVEIYLDNVLIGTAQYGLERVDVNVAYPNYPSGNNSGFTYTIPSQKLSPGNHTVMVKAIGTDGSSMTQSKGFTYTNLDPRLSIDDPSLGATFNPENIKVRGWALHGEAIKEIRISLNGTYLGKATTGLLRRDVNSAYPGYPQENNSGYEYIIPRQALVSGTNTIKVEAIGTDNNNLSETITITANIPAPKVTIDLPWGTTSNANVQVKGWAVNNSDVASIKLYLDGIYWNTATKVVRTDVDAVYPYFSSDSKKGFTYSLPVDELMAGEHILKVEAIGTDGSKSYSSSTFTLTKPNHTVKKKNYTITLKTAISNMMTKSPVIYSSSARAWVSATSAQVEEHLTPGNFINHKTYKYMFLKLNYSDSITAADLDKVLQGKGVLSGKGSVFIQAGKKYNINPIYLVAHALHETGNGTSTLAKGIEVTKWYEREYDPTTKTYNAVYKKDVEKKTVYNMFGIGAYDDNANLWGSQRAYTKEWFSVDAAIMGGAEFIGSDYINAGQDTLYKMRWDVVNKHNYATDVAWAKSQTSRIKSVIDSLNSPKLEFEIPVFMD